MSTSLDLMSLRFGECSVRSRRESLFRCCVSRLLERAWRAKRGEAWGEGVVEKVRSWCWRRRGRRGGILVDCGLVEVFVVVMERKGGVVVVEEGREIRAELIGLDAG